MRNSRCSNGTMTHERHQSAAPEAQAAFNPALEAAYQAAQKSLADGGIPIGAALAPNGTVIASVHNESVKSGDSDCTEKCLPSAQQVGRGTTGTSRSTPPSPMCHERRNHHSIHNPQPAAGLEA